MSSHMKFAIGVTMAAVWIFAAAFMPWAEIHPGLGQLLQVQIKPFTARASAHSGVAGKDG